MSNIWEVLLQSINLSIAALILLIVKAALQDKLSPRWQYGVWSVLALRALWPVSMERSLFFKLPLWIEVWKSRAEYSRDSVLASAWEPLTPRHGLPEISALPRSLTDWLFAIYCLGVLIFLLWHLVSYIRLRCLLRLGGAPSPELSSLLDSVCRRHALRPCPVVTLPGLDSAFVCGVIRPVLAVPESGIPDEKVLLHELLHLRHRDVLQNVFWLLLRALHWFNPLLIPVWNRIGSDLEALCDQRVLERLEGEERRDYGLVLLSMASKKYARAPGTSSISNGADNISLRIEAIARFKKYPAGMALVSVCAGVLLCFSMLCGTAIAYSGADYYPNDSRQLDRAMAVARLRRCSTPDAAVDTYAKALLCQNAVYLAVCTPLDTHQSLAQEMLSGSDYLINSSLYTIDMNHASFENADSFSVYALSPQPDGTYTAAIAFPLDYYRDESGTPLVDDRGGPIPGALHVFVTVYWADGGWVVRDEGDWSFVPSSESATSLLASTYPNQHVYSGTGVHGSVTVTLGSRLSASESGSAPWWQSDTAIDSDLVYNYAQLVLSVDYDLRTRDLSQAPAYGSCAAVEVCALSSPEDVPAFWDEPYKDCTSRFDAENGHIYVQEACHVNWNERVTESSLGTYPVGSPALEAPWGYAVRIYWDNELVEEFIIGEVSR